MDVERTEWIGNRPSKSKIGEQTLVFGKREGSSRNGYSEGKGRAEIMARAAFFGLGSFHEIWLGLYILTWHGVCFGYSQSNSPMTPYILHISNNCLYILPFSNLSWLWLLHPDDLVRV